MHRLFTRGPKRHMGWCATVTTDGNILSCGGSTCFPDACPCVVYNRETDAWDDYFTNMRYARSGGSSSVRLTDGRYFIIGETGDDPA